jgi:hypothetical protein
MSEQEGLRIVVALGVIIAVAGAAHRRPSPIASHSTAPRARARLASYFAAAGVPYPPTRFVVLAFKRERDLLAVYGAGEHSADVRDRGIRSTFAKTEFVAAIGSTTRR